MMKHADLSPETIALAALGWILGNGKRAERLLDLTGLTPDILRDRLAERGVQAAVLEFLIAHEPDLMAASADLDFPPEMFIAAHRRLAPDRPYETSI